jgi:hypothetical protein
MSKDLRRQGFKFAGQQFAYTSFAKEIRLKCGKLVTTQTEGARHFIDRNAPRPGRCQTPDYVLKAAKVPGT